MLVPVAVTLVLSWVAARAVMVAEVDARIDRELMGEAAELALLAEEGVDPDTGAPFADARALLRLYLDRSLPDENETMFAIVDGVVDARSSDIPPVRLDADERLVADLADVDDVTLGSTMTDAGRVRTIAVPVLVADSDSRGTLVVGIFADAEAASVDAVMRGLLLVWALALVIATAVGWLVAGRVLAPVRRVADTARAIGESDLSRRIPVDDAGDGTGDEIDDLARTFNAMLDRLAAGFAAQRAFVDDAGHELLTPLTVARGYLEVMAADGTGDAGERAQARTVVLDELDRMSRIVHDMQALTKATSPGFLRVAPLDVGEVVDEVYVKASALADRRWRLDAHTDAVIVADRQRLVQAMLQLAKNAAAHTTTTDEIGVGASVRGDVVVLHVRDTGPGVPAAERVRIFERFARGASASGDGAGLGLAIVAAIAQAHGGHVVVGDAHDGDAHDGDRPAGARFEIMLPLKRDGIGTDDTTDDADGREG